MHLNLNDLITLEFFICSDVARPYGNGFKFKTVYCSQAIFGVSICSWPFCYLIIFHLINPEHTQEMETSAHILKMRILDNVAFVFYWNSSLAKLTG